MTRLRPFDCPICGGRVPAKAKSCPQCGACDKTGWNEEATASDGLDLPDGTFDYDEFVKEEFGDGKPAKPKGLAKVWQVTGIILVVVIFLLILGNSLFSPY